MFHFPGCPPMRLWIHLMVTGHCPSRVPPFGHPWINAYLQLPMAFRSLSRPSSAISALASTLRSSSLDLASLNPPFLRLLRWPVEPLLIWSVSVQAWTGIPPAPSRISECLPCAVFKVRTSTFRYLLNQVIKTWWAEVDSNHRPHAYQACALTD